MTRYAPAAAGASKPVRPMLSPAESHVIDLNVCIKCGACFEVCKFNAVKKGSAEGVRT